LDDDHSYGRCIAVGSIAGVSLNNNIAYDGIAIKKNGADIIPNDQGVSGKDGIAKPGSQLKGAASQNTYEAIGWNFTGPDAIWKWTGNYPILAWQTGNP
jgi:hypothetical protein